MSKKSGGGPPGGLGQRLDGLESELKTVKGNVKNLEVMLNCNGDGLIAELKDMREYYKATRVEIDRVLTMMNSTIKRNGEALKNNGTSWALKVEGKAVEALKETQRATAGFLQTEQKVMEALGALSKLDSKVASCFAQAMRQCEEAKNEIHDFNTQAFDRGEQLAQLAVRVQNLEEKGKGNPPDRKNVKKRTELTQNVEAIRTNLGNLARAVAEKFRHDEEADGGEEPAGEADGQQGGLREEPGRAQLRYQLENGQRAANMLTRGRPWSEPPRRSRLASAPRSSMVSPVSSEASAPGCGWFCAQDDQVLKGASLLPPFLDSVGFVPPVLSARDPCEGKGSYVRKVNTMSMALQSETSSADTGGCVGHARTLGA